MSCNYTYNKKATITQKDGEKRKPIKVQVHITDSVQKDYYEFESGDTEALIGLIHAQDAHQQSQVQG